MKFGEMDPMHVPSNPSGVPMPDPWQEDGPDEPENFCAHCLEPIPAHKRWCSDSCFRAEDHYEE